MLQQFNISRLISPTHIYECKANVCDFQLRMNQGIFHWEIDSLFWFWGPSSLSQVIPIGIVATFQFPIRVTHSFPPLQLQFNFFMESIIFLTKNLFNISAKKYKIKLVKSKKTHYSENLEIELQDITVIIQSLNSSISNKNNTLKPRFE